MPRLDRLRRIAATGPVLTGLAGFVCMALTATVPTPAAAEMSDSDRQEVRDIVRQYILDNPEIITEAVGILRTRQAEQEKTAATKAIKSNADALFRADDDPVLGNPDGDVTVVEFFDYRCGYCKHVFGPVMDTVKTDGKVRLVMKEFPILGPESVLAARWSLAARDQGHYAPFHQALMTHRGDITDEVLRHYATQADMDVDKAAAYAESPAVEKTLRETMKLAAQLGISGTPAFVIGDQLIPGALDTDTLKSAIAATREKS